MKKLKLLFACIFLCTATAFADDILVNEEKFPDENFRNWILQQPWGSDGVITDAEIAEITNISGLDGRNISDLTGIEVFVNLDTLIVRNNQLTSLDVSNLTNLTHLNVGGNPFTSLDISNLVNLTTLSIWGSQFTSFDISNLPNLANVTFAVNHLLTSLNISDLPNLWNLNVGGNNQLTLLNISNFPNLEFLAVQNNQLTSLYLSNLPSLLSLDVRNNQLTSLDLTGLNRLIGHWVNIGNQNPTLALTGANNNYSLEIELNNPTNLVNGLLYENGILTSTNRTITSSPFSVATGNSIFRLHGTLTLIYPTETNIPEINLNRTPVAFYTITGVRLGQKPQSGIFIILYCDGSAEKVMR